MISKYTGSLTLKVHKTTMSENEMCDGLVRFMVTGQFAQKNEKIKLKKPNLT